jgi:hypothetical protein
MFSDKKFYEVNREERHYGFLPLSSLIYDQKFLSSFIKLIQEKNIIDFTDSKDLDIYAEVALFRDYWFDLGDHKKYTNELHKSRFEIVKSVLNIMNINSEIIEQYDFFWTGKIGESKLWYPGRWEIEKMKDAEQNENINNFELLRIRWAFNAKPDILIKSSKQALFIELKIESGIGENQEGYDQEQTQKDIILFAKEIIPEFLGNKVERLLISQNEPNSIKWLEFESFFNNELVKKYMSFIPKQRNA